MARRAAYGRRELPLGQLGEDAGTRSWLHHDYPVLAGWRCPHVLTLPGPYGPERVVPYVLEALNEGGYLATYLCLDCLIDWLVAAGMVRRPELPAGEEG